MNFNKYLLILALIAIVSVAIQTDAQEIESDNAEDGDDGEDAVRCSVRPKCQHFQRLVNCRCVPTINRCPPGTILLRQHGRVECVRLPQKQCKIFCQPPKVNFGCKCVHKINKCPPRTVLVRSGSRVFCKSIVSDSEDNEDDDSE